MKKSQGRISGNLLSKFMEASEILTNGVMWLNAEGHLLGFNQKFAKDLGYNQKNFEPKTIYEVNPSTSLLSWRRLWKKLLMEGQLSLETEQITKDDSIYPIEMRCVLMELDNQQVCMSVVVNLMQTNRYKDILNLTSEIAGIGGWEWDLVQDNFLFTDEMYGLLQLPSNKPVTKSFLLKLIDSSISDQYKEPFEVNMTQAVKEGKAFDMELLVKVNKNYESFHLSAKPVWLEDQTIKINGTLQNINKISKRTDELYFTQFCMDNARDMIFWLEPDGIITYLNKTACQKLGYTSKEIIGQKMTVISPFSMRDLEEHWRLLKEQKTLEYESMYITSQGIEIPVSIIANYFKYQGREFNCGFVRDLSKKKKRDELITLAKHSLDQSIDMVFWLKKDASFHYFNDAFVKKSGYTRKEIMKMKITDFFPSTTMEDFNQGWKKLQQGGAIQSFDRMMIGKNDKPFPTEMTVKLVKVGDKEYSSTILRDITIRKQKEAELEAHLKKIEELQQITEEENIQLREEINLEFNFNNIITRDPNYKKVLRKVEQVADTDATVLILGETGTGKELLARAVHELSERADKPMIKVNCGALPENLIESELFGHEKGAFTGAYQRKIGKFERANKGTIFLDEIGELPLDLQSKLLRVLQEGEIERIGGEATINIDVRVIAATNRKLEELVEKGKFREDLYYRLNVFPIYNIPLRERREDVPVLVKHFTEKYSKKINKEISEISQSGMNKLMSYNFLGNVRELENMVERAVILAKNKVLSFDAVLFKSSTLADSKFKTMEEMQKSHIIKALKRTKGKVSGRQGAAELLEMNDKTLTSRMRKLSISKKDYLKK